MLFLFDCDGVLVDSEVVAAKVDSEVLASAGHKVSTDDVIRLYAGLTFRSMAALIEKETGKKLPETIFAEQRQKLDARLKTDSRPVGDIETLLKTLSAPCAVCSNSSGERLKITLGGAGLYERFAPHVYSAVEVGDRQPKPAPNVYSHAAAQLGAAPRDCIVIEDSVYGIAAAKSAGMRVVGFTGGAHSWPSHADLLTEAGAETVINRFRDLPAVAEAFAVWDGLKD